MAVTIEGQLNDAERRFLTDAILCAEPPPRVVVEIGTWLGGGSTLHILRALHRNGVGHLWGVEAERSIYERMIANIRAAVPEALDRFTPLFGRSEEVLPRWLSGQDASFRIDVAFLDGSDNPGEQIAEFELLDPVMPVGAQLMAHDARMRKGKLLTPYLARLDHWESQVLDLSPMGLLHARKRAAAPSPESRAAALRCLTSLRRSPREVLARLLPSRLKGAVLSRLPQRISWAILQGRK